MRCAVRPYASLSIDSVSWPHGGNEESEKWITIGPTWEKVIRGQFLYSIIDQWKFKFDSFLCRFASKAGIANILIENLYNLNHIFDLLSRMDFNSVPWLDV